MRIPPSRRLSAAGALVGALSLLSTAQENEAPIGVPVPGEVIDEALHGPSWIESMDAVLEREAAVPPGPHPVHRMHNGEPGHWQVPSRKSTCVPHSGEHYATVTWGDPRIGLGFNGLVDIAGAWFAGQGSRDAWAAGLELIAFSGGSEVARVWLDELTAEPAWFAMNLEQVDFLVFEAQPVAGGSGYFALDDLTFTRAGETEPVVLTFDDLSWKYNLTESSYGGLTWTMGSGDFQRASVVHPPRSPLGPQNHSEVTGGALQLGGAGTAPTVGTNFRGPRISDPGAGWLPPDTHGAVGPAHYISVVNQHMSVYDKQTGQRLVNTSLSSFFNSGGSNGDPRVLYDHYADRWIVIACNFSTGVRLGVSLTNDPTGSWFKTFVTFSAGSDSGNWPDYPLLGYDQEGIYMAAYMVGGNFLMSIFAIDKAPLLAGSPSLGTVTAWRQLPWEGAIQPCVTYEDPGPEYLVSRRTSTSMRLRKIDGPLTSPTMTELGFASTPSGGSPPSAEAQGGPNVSTVDARPMNAVYRLGSVWTANTVNVGGRAAARWYEINVGTVSTNQVGTFSDSSFHYYFPTIAVTSTGDAGVGFSGSSPNAFPGAYFAGRVSTDPAGEMSAPALYQPGLAPYTGGGGNPQRFGDYSMTNVDTSDDSIWTIQEYSDSNSSWSTWIAQLEFPPTFPLPFNYCTAKTNSIGFDAPLSWAGTPSFTQNSFELTCTHLLPFKNGLAFWGTGQAALPFFSGTLCTNPPLARGPVILSDAFGISTFQENFPIDAIGTTRNYQWWYRDPAIADGTGVGLSNAAEVAIAP